jgi:hypothetical protein
MIFARADFVACAGIVAADIMVNHLSSSTQNRFWGELSDGHISRKGSFHFGNGNLSPEGCCSEFVSKLPARPSRKRVCFSAQSLRL